MNSVTQAAAMHGSRRANVLGVGVHAVDMRRAVEVIESAVQDNRKGYVCVTGVHGIMEAQRDAELGSILRNALLVAPDGMPTVWVGWCQGLWRMRRVFGPDLMWEVCRASVAKGFTHFLYGGTQGVAQELRARCEAAFPGVRIVGTYTPPFRPLNVAEQGDLMDSFARLKPDITWVGLSTPKQERLMAEYLPRLATKVMIGVGAAFDLHTGRMKDSPRWVKQAGLQWAHRLLQDPGRLWKRYRTNNPRFLWSMAMQLAGIKRYALEEGSSANSRTVAERAGLRSDSSPQVAVEGRKTPFERV
jgi:N-acetylglucosaminyldiphosphoundecaprenol N-acetyl-beta-D-mannosaminyltransferase